MRGFKSFCSAKITIAGIENIHIIQKCQLIGSTFWFETLFLLFSLHCIWPKSDSYNKATEPHKLLDKVLN